MVCVRQENSNTFTILSYLVASVDVLTTIINMRYMADSRFFFYRSNTVSLKYSHFLLSLYFDLTQPGTVDLRLPHVTDVRLYVTQQLSIGTCTTTLHLRHVERSVFHLTVQDA